MRIGLITIYQVPNYGSVLQAFATQCVLEQLGCECSIINYRYPNEWHWNHGAPKPQSLKLLVRKIFPKTKCKVLEEFRREFLNLTRRFYNYQDLIEADWCKYDAFVVGSDQVWNARFVHGDSVFMLSFVPENKPRYSLASSFASKTLPEQFRVKYKNELMKFSALSVREQNGVCIINKELDINKNIKVILDPTLLLSRVDWLKAIPRASSRKNKKYILFYMLTYASNPRPYIYEVARFYQKKMNCDVIALAGYTKPENTDGLVMTNRCSATIPEFIDLFANSELVITNSFHGTAFALNFGRPLISIVPTEDGDDRQTTLLGSLNCEHLAIRVGTDVLSIRPYYDFNEEQDLLNNIRADSLNWIKDTIKV